MRTNRLIACLEYIRNRLKFVNNELKQVKTVDLLKERNTLVKREKLTMRHIEMEIGNF